MATTLQQAQGFNLPGIDYTLTKPVDYSASVDQVVNWGSNQRQREIQKMQQEAALSGQLPLNEMKIGPNGAVTSGLLSPEEAERKRMIAQAQIANYGNMMTNRDAGAAQGWARVGQGQERVDIYGETARTQQAKNLWGMTPMILGDGTIFQPTPGGGSVTKGPQASPQQVWDNARNEAAQRGTGAQDSTGAFLYSNPEETLDIID